MEDVERIAEGAEIVVVHNGDITWGRSHVEALVSGREYDQQAIAVANMQRWLEWDNVKTMRLMHGTESHEFGRGSSSIAVASRLQALYPRESIRRF